MTDSIALRIVQDTIAELNAETPTGVPEATNRRHLPDEEVKSPRLAVFLGDENTVAPRQKSDHDPITRRQLVLAVQCIGVTDSVGQLDACVDLMLQHAIATLGRSRLDGLVYSLRESGTTRRAYQNDRFVMVLTVLFEVSYQTRRNDVTKH